MSDLNLIAKINECKEAILSVCTQINDLRRENIKIEFLIGMNQGGMQELVQFHAYKEVDLSTSLSSH